MSKIDNLEYSVERIVDKKVKNGIVYYKVKWEGYADHLSTWEPIENLTNVIGLIEDFEESRRCIYPFAFQEHMKLNQIEENRFKSFLNKHKPVQVKDVIRNSNGMLVAYLLFTSNFEISDSVVPTYLLAEKYPGILIDFYESKIQFIASQ